MKNKLTSILTSALTIGLLSFTATIHAENYTIDTKGMHAFIQFRVQHLGYSWLYGRFNAFSGSFSYDELAPEEASLEITIDTSSVDSNHAERDKHLRSDDFLDVSKFPDAKFVSKSFAPDGNGGGVMTGDFTLRGISKPIDITVTEIGAGDDPWGGYRRGFNGTAKFAMADYAIKKNLGPKSKDVELILAIEGVRQ